METFRGNVALVTGAGGGIGLATATAFAEAGASVVLQTRMPYCSTRLRTGCVRLAMIYWR